MKNQLKKIRLLTIALFLLCISPGWAQSNTGKIDYKNNPYWVEMINDSTVNYFEAVQAFRTFWKDRKAPVEDDIIVDDKEEKEEWTLLKRIFNSKEYKQEKEAQEYSFEYKRFKHWQLMVEPYVQADGRILSTQEQLEIWRQQRQ